MKNLIALTILILTLGLTSCGSDSDEGETPQALGALSSKSIFSLWQDTTNGYQLDFRGGYFNHLMYLTIDMPISQDWIDTLSNNAYDTTGLVAGNTTECTYTIVVTGEDTAGTFTVSHAHQNNAGSNACLMLDNICGYESDDTCHMVTGDAHVYKVQANKLYLYLFDGLNYDFEYK